MATLVTLYETELDRRLLRTALRRETGWTLQPRELHYRLSVKVSEL